MFVCLERHHYNKAPLGWLSMRSYWGMHHPALYKLLLTNLVIFVEYPVENTHTIIRSKTNTHDTAEQIQKKAKVVSVKNGTAALQRTLHPTQETAVVT